MSNTPEFEWLDVTTPVEPPRWAKLERDLMARLESASAEFIARYTREDGTLIWRDEWPGMDGSDDPYEAFMYLALFYSLGGSEKVYEAARKMWDAITWQWTQYGQIEREFDGYYDWMHHGEANLFHYFFGLAKPASLVDRQRAENFAKMYNGEDPKAAANYDAELGIITAPQSGSRGPRHIVTAEDLGTHRGVLVDYLPPFEDMTSVAFDEGRGRADWLDDAVFAEVIELMNQRTTRGDVPLNLNATGQFAHAFMYSGAEKHRQWVVDYLARWAARADANEGGVMPDNVGLSGEVGEYQDGKWWGGHYGWRWPHGLFTILEPLINAGTNAYLLTGDDAHLDAARKQIDINFGLGHAQDDGWVVPNKRFDGGWADYRPASPFHAVHMWARTLSDADHERVERVPRTTDWSDVSFPVVPFSVKHYNVNTLAWYEYMQGHNADFPERALDANSELLEQQLARMRSDDGDPRAWDMITHLQGFPDTVSLQADGYAIHAWMEFNPVYFESLVQLMWGAPMHISHGGFQHATVRYFDAELQRPGLPADVAALVRAISPDEVTIELVNVGSFEHDVVVQAGGFGEHQFTSVLSDAEGTASDARTLDSTWVGVRLAPGAGAVLRLGMRRYVNEPSYQTPWSRREDWAPLIKGRQIDV
ncbi:hypothetical protein [Microbacterium sp. H1-D42]|uniref:hypothetical protein n=1 Tax=Microbacterium sp. H1-D42 TaxID=2925844 RepID=UPI001F53C193|nr:hypothetical protein [Microbacterium sp. H1-D42]UNK70490.1 hypothetical protein MNR00_15225 [Microbacterium sp. H1-D42]